MPRLIKNAEVLTPGESLVGYDVFVENGRVSALARHDSALQDQAVDAAGCWLAPGFIDLQINGAFGKDFTHMPSSLWEVAAGLPRFGVTSFLPTVITSPLETVAQVQAAFCAGPPPGFRGAVPLGLHVEGPYLNPERKGAHEAEYLRRPALAEIANFSPEQGVRLVTLAPELPGADELIRALTGRGVIVSAGHSLATAVQAQEAFAAGVTWGTHLFNAMPPLSHFEPGLVGALLNAPAMRFGLIPDGVHVHPLMVALVWKLSGPERLTIVTDAMAALGMPPGEYRLGRGQAVHVDEHSARLESGVLAGSILQHHDAVRNLVRFTNCTINEALACFTSTPAAVLGMEAEIGRIEPGFKADFVLLSKDFAVRKTFVEGVEVFSGEGE